MNHPARWLAMAIAVAALGLAAWHWRGLWWGGAPAPAAPQASAPVPTPVTTAAAPASAPPPVRHPIEAASAPEFVEPAVPGVEGALARLVGNELLATLVRREDFVRHVVATVDNLGREKVPARLWPLSPPAGRFSTLKLADSEVIAPDNFVRYARHLDLIEKVDLQQGVALYKRFYPQFQQAYEDLGYPGRHFNDRVVEVIDLMLATAEPTPPLAVRLPAIQGPIQPQRPWLLYEFADPARQSLAAGPQLLLRMGPDNQRRVKARLRELRRLLTRN